MFDKNNPFYATITERYSLCKAGSQKNTQHIVLNIQNSNITYDVGDSVAIFPINDARLVEKTLTAMNATGEEAITDKHGQTTDLRTYLTEKANITDISRKLLSEVLKKTTDPELEAIEKDHALLKEYQNTHEVWDLLEKHPQAKFTPEELCALFMPLLPRFYSIASSMKAVGDEIHLTVAFLNYYTRGHLRLGVCTHYLCNLAPINEAVVPMYVHPHKGFTLPANPETPIIMIGPGTGIAPYRAFMQERAQTGIKGINWLFFGEWHRAHNYFYEEYWEDLAKKDLLKLSLAFSRDQDHKIYVQHRMREEGAELFNWLQKGAVLYVCGDAHHMAKDVDAALLEIVQEHGKLPEEDAKNYIKDLRHNKRYLRDVY